MQEDICIHIMYNIYKIYDSCVWVFITCCSSCSLKLNAQNLISILGVATTLLLSHQIFSSRTQHPRTHSHTPTCVAADCSLSQVCVCFFFFGLSHTRLRGKYTHAFSFIYRLIAMQADKTWDVDDDDDNYSTTRRNKNKQTNTQTDRQTTKRKGRGRRVGKRGGAGGEELGRCSKNSLLHWQGKHLEIFFCFQGSRTSMSAKVSFVI